MSLFVYVQNSIAFTGIFRIHATLTLHCPSSARPISFKWPTFCISMVSKLNRLTPHAFNYCIRCRHSELKEAMPNQQSRYTSAEKLDGLLRKMCGEGVGNSLVALRSRWDSLDILMESFQEVIRGQVWDRTLDFLSLENIGAGVFARKTEDIVFAFFHHVLVS